MVRVILRTIALSACMLIWVNQPMRGEIRHGCDPLTYCPAEPAPPPAPPLPGNRRLARASLTKRTVFWRQTSTPGDAATHLCKTSHARLLSGVSGRHPAPPHPCVRDTAGVRLPPMAEQVNRRDSGAAAGLSCAWLVGVCSPLRSDTAAVHSKHWVPSHTFQFVFAALLLNDGEPIRGRGCRGEGGVSLLRTPTLPSARVCVCAGEKRGGGLEYERTE